MLQIRKMMASDIAQVAKLEHEIFSEPWSADSFERVIDSENDVYLVAAEDDKIVGYCGLWGVIDEGQITNVAVSPEHRRQGVAERMLTELMSEASARKFTEFTLEVRKSNRPAIDLYHKLGFKDEGIRRDFYNLPVEDAIIMWKRTKLC